MKKIIIPIAVIVIAVTTVQAQGFLKNLKKNIEKVVGTPESEQTQDQKDENTRKTETTLDINNVTPAKGNTAEQLYAELPQMPPIDIVLNPENATQNYLNAFHKQIEAVNIRIAELRDKQDQLYEESGAEQKAEKQAKEKSAKMMGLTPAEMDELQSDKLTPAREKELQDKIMRNMTGMSADQAAATDKMSEKEQQAYIMKNADMNKFNQFTQAAKQMDPSGGELQKASDAYKAKIDQSQKRFDNAMSQIKNIESKYFNELKTGYDQLYRSPSSTERDALTDRLTPLSKKCRQETVQIWYNAHKQRITDAIAAIPEMKKLDEICISINQKAPTNGGIAAIEEVINVLNDVLEFNPFSDISPAHYREIVFNGAKIDFTYAESVAAVTFSCHTTDNIGTGGYLPVQIIEQTRDKWYVIDHNGVRKGPFADSNTAHKEVGMSDDGNINGDLAGNGDAKWQSASGKRYAIYKDGQLILNDGSTYNAYSIHKCGDFLYWLTSGDSGSGEYCYHL